jgi:hypothetical protein
MAFSPAAKKKYFALREKGFSISAAAREVGADRNTGRAWENDAANGPDSRVRRAELTLPDPRREWELPAEAQRALKDFGYFRYRYLGRRSTPWQEEAAYNTVNWLASEDTELIVCNCPPGSGKSTLFTNDIPLWMICRDRTIRIFLGHRVISKSTSYAMRIRKALERTKPLPANPAQGRTENAEGCLAADFGRFRPNYGDLWTQGEFTVMSEYGDEESSIEDKESTVTAEAKGSEFLGIRSNLVIWDDLVTGSVLRNQDLVENERQWWDNEGVTRVEPGGALLLVGQRMGAEDLYRYCLNEKLTVEVDGEVVDTDTPRYKQIVYPAHFEDRCKGEHGKKIENAYPDGCLLDPFRIPWSGATGLMTIKRNREEKYAVQYQQLDVDPSNVLVQQLWIDGGRDKDGNIYPGCWDSHRGLCEWPRGLSAPWYSIATADPSPSKFWAIEWWLYHPASEQRFLLDLVRQNMEAGDFLDWNANDKQFFGLMHDWQVRSKALGLPITHWIIEQNAAQKFLLQYDHVKRWQRLNHIELIGHNTTVLKLSEEYGIQMLANLYKFGNIRLPGKGISRTASLKLIYEATRYPDVSTTDCLMAQYFLEFNLPSLSKVRKEMPRLARPSWMGRR